MIRGTRRSDAGLQCRQTLRKYEVEGGVWETVTPWVSYSLVMLMLQNRSGIRQPRGNRVFFPPRTLPGHDLC
jgi:hypothetical protein